MEPHVSRVIELSPPVNHICRIEQTDDGYLRLTLRNGGTLRIALHDAVRYGIAHILNESR